jgi:hypothetical protein
VALPIAREGYRQGRHWSPERSFWHSRTSIATSLYHATSVASFFSRPNDGQQVLPTLVDIPDMQGDAAIEPRV